MLIRDIKSTDKEQIVSLAEMFFKERIEREGVTFSRNVAETYFDVIMRLPKAVTLCAEQDGEIIGMIAGTFSEIIFAKELALQELVWYVKSDKRFCGIRLLKTFEERAKELGADYIIMVGMSGDDVLKFYPRFDYEELQRQFIKRVV